MSRIKKKFSYVTVTMLMFRTWVSMDTIVTITLTKPFTLWWWWPLWWWWWWWRGSVFRQICTKLGGHSRNKVKDSGRGGSSCLSTLSPLQSHSKVNWCVRTELVHCSCLGIAKKSADPKCSTKDFWCSWGLGGMGVGVETDHQVEVKADWFASWNPHCHH